MARIQLPATIGMVSHYEPFRTIKPQIHGEPHHLKFDREAAAAMLVLRHRFLPFKIG